MLSLVFSIRVKYKPSPAFCQPLNTHMKRLLEHLLQEDDCARIFGNTLFGDLNGGEKDLTQEKEIRKAVQSFFSDKLTYRDKPETVVNAFRELLKCKGKFPNELQPNVSLVYRGVRMTMPDILKIKDWKFVDDTRQEIIGTGNYQSKYPIQSWSASKIRAEFFAIDFPSWRKKKIVPAIVIAIPSKNEMLFNTSFVKNLKMSSKRTAKFSNEQEIVRVSNDSLSCKFLIPVQYLKMIEGVSQPVIDHLATTAGLRITA